MSPTLLWAGLGNMGRGMCKNIVEKAALDSPLLLYNRSVQRAVDLNSRMSPGKTEVVESLSAAVDKAVIILTCLANDDAVTEFMRNVIENKIDGKLIIDCSTIHPDTTDAIAKLIVEHGAEFVAAPVFGAPAVADAGQLVAVLAGPGSSVARARPFFEGVTARAIIDMSDQPYGKASKLKVLGNSFILAMIEQLAEGHVVAEKSGLGNDSLHQFVEAVFGGPYSAYSKRMLSGDYHKREEPLFAVDLALKDARHARNLAEGVGAKLQIAEIGEKHLCQVKEQAGSLGDIVGVYGAVRAEAGLKFENTD